MDQHHHSITKVCPRCDTPMRLVKAGSTFVWKCPACQHVEPLSDVHTFTDRHTFTFNPSLQELRIAWPGCPKMTQFLSLEECHQLQALLNRELPRCPYLAVAQEEVSRV